MKRTTYSVVIPALNEEKFLPNLLASLAKQSHRNFEVIVVDGKSQDNTVTVAKTYSQSLPKLTVCIADHASLPYQRNLGAEHAEGEWIIFVDADSVLLPYALESIDAYIRQHNPLFLTAWFKPDSDIPNDAVLTLLGNIFLEWSKIIHRPLAPGPFTAVKKEIFQKVGGYDVDHPFLEDQDFSQRMTKLGIVLHIIRETLCVFSLRRYRKQGTLKILQAYAKAIIPIFIAKKTPKNMKGYVMGGQMFTDKQYKVKKSILKVYEQKIKRLMRELFE